MCALLRLMDIRHYSFRTLCLYSDSNVGVGQTEHVQKLDSSLLNDSSCIICSTSRSCRSLSRQTFDIRHRNWVQCQISRTTRQTEDIISIEQIFFRVSLVVFPKRHSKIVVRPSKVCKSSDQAVYDYIFCRQIGSFAADPALVWLEIKRVTFGCVLDYKCLSVYDLQKQLLLLSSTRLTNPQNSRVKEYYRIRH